MKRRQKCLPSPEIYYFAVHKYNRNLYSFFAEALHTGDNTG